MDSRRRIRSLLLIATTTAALITFALLPRVGRAEIDAWPLLEIDDDTTTVAYPLFVQEGEFMMVFPFYYRTNQGEDHHVLWPLVKVSEGELDRLAPIYFRAHDDAFTLFPLIHQTKASTWWLAPPVYLSRSSDFHAVFPFYAHDEETTWVLPNLRIDRGESGALERVRSLGVFDYAVDLGGEERSLDAIFLSSFAWGGSETHARVLPLFSQSNAPDSRSTWLGPFHHAVRAGATSHCVLPLYCEIRKSELHSRFIGPWYMSTNPEREVNGVLGLYDTRDELRQDGGRVEKLSMLAWRYGRKVERDPQGEITSRARRFVIFTDEREGERRRLGLLGFPIWERSAG